MIYLLQAITDISHPQADRFSTTGHLLGVLAIAKWSLAHLAAKDWLRIVAMAQQPPLSRL